MLCNAKPPTFLINKQPFNFHLHSFELPSCTNTICNQLSWNAIMSTSIPTSTSLTESSVIPAPLSAVWHLIKLQDFHVFWSKLSKSEHVKGASPETDVVKWTFKDGTVLDVKQEEHSVRRSLDRLCPFNAASAQPQGLASHVDLGETDAAGRQLIITLPTPFSPLRLP